MCLRFVFAQPDLKVDAAREGAASSLAAVMLKAHLESVDSIRNSYKIEVVPFVPTVSASVRFTDRNREYYLNKLLVPKPVGIGFSLYVWNVAAAREMARSLKAASPETLLIAGGPETADGATFLKECPEFDVAVEGEGPGPLTAILQRLADGRTDMHTIPNVWQRMPEGVLGSSDGTSFTGMAQAGAGNLYPECSLPHTAYITMGSGCPNRCSYCLWAKTPAVSKPPEVVLDELNRVLDRGVKRLFFCDADLVDLRRQSPRVYRSMVDLLNRVPDVRTRLFANVVHLGDDSLEEVAREMGAAWIHLGLQSLQPDVLNAVGRGWSIPSLSNLERAPKYVRERLVVELMYPLPEETFSTLWGGVQRLIDMGYSLFYLYPVSAFRGTILRKQIQDDPRFAFQPHAPYYLQQTPSFTRDQWLQSAPTSYVLNQLTTLASEAPDNGGEMVGRILAGRPRVVNWIQQQCDAGSDASGLVEQMVQEAFGQSVEFQYEGRHIAAFHGGGGPHPAQPHPTKPQAVPMAAGTSAPVVLATADFVVSPESMGLPSESQVLGWLAAVGARVDDLSLDPDAWRVEAHTAGGPLNISIWPSSHSGPAYGTIGTYKVTYQGNQVDFKALDRLCGKYRFAGPNRPGVLNAR